MFYIYFRWVIILLLALLVIIILALQGIVITGTFLNSEKSVKMTEFGKSRIRSLIKVGYFLSLLKFSNLGRDIKSEPY